MPEEPTATAEPVETDAAPLESPPETTTEVPPETPDEILDTVAPAEEETEEAAAEPSEEEKREEETEDPPKEEGKPPEEKPEEKTEEKEETPKTEEKVEEPEEDKALSENVKAAFKSAPELRASYFRDRKFSELLGTTENAEFVMGKYEDAEKRDSLYYSEKPEDHRSLLQGMAEDDPNAFDRITGAVVQNAHQFYVEHLKQIGRYELAQQLEEIDGIFSGKTQPQAYQQSDDPMRAQLDKDRAALAQERSTYTSERRDNFLSEVRGTFEKKVDDDITKTLKDLTPDGLSEWAEGNLRRNVIGELSQTLIADKIHSSQMKSLIDGGKFKNRDEVLKSMNTRVGPLISQLVAKELSKATGQAVKTATDKAVKREKVKAKSKEPGSSGSPSRPAREKISEMKPKEGESSYAFFERLAEATQTAP